MSTTYMNFGTGVFHVDGDAPLTQDQVDSVWHHLPTTGAGWVEKGRLFVQQRDDGFAFDLGPVESGVKGVSTDVRFGKPKKSTRAHSTRKKPVRAARAHATKKSPAQLDREIAEVVPGWARGLDLSESRELAKRLHVSQADLEAKQRRIESDRRAALPSLSITDTGGGIFVRVSSPGVGYGKVTAVEKALKAFQIPIANAIPPNIFVPVHKIADKTKAREKVEEALRHAGYRV